MTRQTVEETAGAWFVEFESGERGEDRRRKSTKWVKASPAQEAVFVRIWTLELRLRTYPAPRISRTNRWRRQGNRLCRESRSAFPQGGDRDNPVAAGSSPHAL